MRFRVGSRGIPLPIQYNHGARCIVACILPHPKFVCFDGFNGKKCTLLEPQEYPSRSTSLVRISCPVPTGRCTEKRIQLRVSVHARVKSELAQLVFSSPVSLKSAPHYSTALSHLFVDSRSVPRRTCHHILRPQPQVLLCSARLQGNDLMHGERPLFHVEEA